MDDEHGAEGALDEAAGRPLDETDDNLLREVAQLLTDVDPVPDDLVERIQFSLALDEMFSEVAAITRMPTDAMSVRGDAAGTRTETLTFSAQRLQAMVTVTRTDDGIRVDGWVAPAGATAVRLRMQEEQLETTVDESGRFVFEALAEGFAQLSFHPLDGDDADAVVVTPLFQL
jgi:hypothetical protein